MADPILEALAATEIFTGLSPLQLSEIARRADRIVFNPGDVIMARDEDCDAATIVIDGDAVCLRGEADEPVEVPVEPGSILAELAMVIETSASTTVVARSRVRGVRISRDDMLAQIADDPGMSEHLIDNVNCRLRAVADQLRAIEAGLGSWPDEDRGDDATSSAPRRPAQQPPELHVN